MEPQVRLTVRKRILRIAWPAIVSNVTVPLLGLADTAIVGHLGSAVYIGAIAVGGMIFSMVYWLFGFLRGSTSGFASQAYGAGSPEGVTHSLVRALVFACLTAAVLLVLQRPLGDLALCLVNATEAVEAEARTYYNICIWGAPAMLMLYGFNGWYIGLQNTRVTMAVALVQNILNIVLSLFFVFVCGMKVAGVALGTVVAQYAGLALAMWVWRRHYPQYAMDFVGFRKNYVGYKSFHIGYRKSRARHRFRLPGLRFRQVFQRQFFTVNRDIFLRTLCLIAVTSFFTIAGARQGDLVLAANALLLQLFYLFSYFMDGFANAGEALSGESHGACSAEGLKQVLLSLFSLGILLTVLFTLAYACFAMPFLSLLSDDADVLAMASRYRWWIVAVPFAGFAAFLWDGVFMGLTTTRRLLRSMASATVVFFAVYFIAMPVMGNDGLWLAFVSYLFVRGLVQTLYCPQILREERRREG